MLNYNARIIYKKAGKHWKKESASTNKQFIDSMLKEKLYYKYVVKHNFITRIVQNYDTLSVYYSDGIKAVYKYVLSIYGDAITEYDILKMID